MRTKGKYLVGVAVPVLIALASCEVPVPEAEIEEPIPEPLIDGIHDLVYEEGEAARQCLLGWWTDPPMPCWCPRQPECKYGDCVSYGFERLMETGEYAAGSISVSEKGKSVTTWAVPLEGTFTSTDKTYTVKYNSGSEAESNYRCSGDRLKIGYLFSARLDPKLSASLERLAEDGYQWSESPLDL